MVFHIVKNIDDYYSHLMHKKWSNKLIICYFTASWCGPCKMISPDIETLGSEAEHVLVLKIDVDDCEEVASQCKIDCMPTFKFHLKNSIEPVTELMGADKTKLFNIIGDLISTLSVPDELGEADVPDELKPNGVDITIQDSNMNHSNMNNQNMNQPQLTLQQQMEIMNQMSLTRQNN